MKELGVICALSLLVSVALTGAVRRLAMRHGVLDVPNERSSHTTVTPRGGGSAIVLTVTLAAVGLVVLGKLQSGLFLAVVVCGLPVAIVGFVDDRRPVKAGVRLAVHCASAVCAVVLLGGLPILAINSHLVSAGWLGYVLATLGIVWTLNLFNFMDGIDGIAASEAAFVTFGSALLCLHRGGSTAPLGIEMAFAAASLGFLLWNWPPARIFMGDVGSGYLGYVVAVLALADAIDDPPAVWAWLILGGVFFVDSTVTLIRRTLRGQRVHIAHRSHAYQWLARRWGSHLKVTVGVAFLNILWLFPCAVIATRYPQWALWTVAAAFAPLVCFALIVGAGRDESSA